MIARSLFPALFLSFAAVGPGCGGDLQLLDSGNARNDAAFDLGTDAVRDAGVDSVDGFDAVDVGIDAGSDVSNVSGDAGGDVRDGSDVGSDSGTDATDVGTDAGPSGRCTPVIDGVIGGDWSSAAIVASNSAVTAWGVGLNELRSIRVCYDATSVYLGIDGESESVNAIVTYIDRDYNPPSGAPTGVSIFSALTDRAGALDSRVSANLMLGAGAGNFGAEAAWGTDGALSLGATALSDNVGLRLIGPSSATLPDGGAVPDRRADFSWTMGAQSTCSTTAPLACEVAIAWASLFEGPRPTNGRIALFVRINNTDGSMSSNQTLPQDDATAPRVINRVLVIPFAP